MEAQGMPQWGADGRAALILAPASPAGPPLLSPEPKHSRGHIALVAAIVLLMVLGVGAIFCCCYQWEGQLRVQARASAAGRAELPPAPQLGAPDHPQVAGARSNHPQRESSFSVVMPGDDVPRFVAWASPRTSTTDPALIAEPIPHFQISGKNTRGSAAGLQVCIPS